MNDPKLSEIASTIFDINRPVSPLACDFSRELISIGRATMPVQDFNDVMLLCVEVIALSCKAPNDQVFARFRAVQEQARVGREEQSQHHEQSRLGDKSIQEILSELGFTVITMDSSK